MEGRKTKKEEMIKEIAAQFIERESNKTALITITRVVLDDKARNGIIYFTALPESGEESALNFLKRKRRELREAITKGMPVHPIPFLDVAIDDGEKARLKIEDLLRE